MHGRCHRALNTLIHSYTRYTHTLNTLIH
jgi:hypothetical protein